MSVTIATFGILPSGTNNLPPLVIAGVSSEVLNNIIRERFQCAVVDRIVGGLPTQYDNAPFEKPENSEWCRLTIRHSESNQVAFGETDRFRTRGIMIAQVFTPIMEGDLDAYVICDLIATSFRSVNVKGVQFRTPTIGNRARMEKEWQLNVTCPFFADQIA